MATEAAESIEAETPPEITTGGATVEIPPDPEPGEQPETGKPKPSRADRRAARGQDYAEEARQSREALEREREGRHALELKVAELSGRVTAGESGKPDPNEAALSEIATKIENVVARMGQGDDTARTEWHKLRREESRIIARMEAAAEGKGVEERVTKAMPRQMDPRQAALMAEFPALQDDAEFKDVANGHVARLIRMEKRDMQNPTVRFATLREGAALAARDLGMGGDNKGAPTERDRARVSGTGSGDSGAGAPGGTKVHLNADQVALAHSMFRSLPKPEAEVKWWKEIGSKIPK